MSKQPPAKTAPPPSDAKHYSFSADEFLYINEHRALIELHDSLIRRYVQVKVMPRVGVDGKKYLVRLSQDGQGIDCTPQIETKA